MKRYKSYLIIIIIILGSCSVARQAEEISRLADCEFRLASVEQLKLAGVNIQGIKSYSDLRMTEMARIGTTLAGGTLPLDFILNVEAKNPNTAQAAMSRLEWIILIDNIEMANGIIEKRIIIPPDNGVAIIPVKINIDLVKHLSGQSAGPLLNFGFNLAGVGGTPTRITLKAKPTIYVGSRAIEYPGYIKITQKY
jgi:hypothetical protein